jgi:hypothetical protein
MDPQDAAPGPPESRTGAFSLGADSQKFNAMVPKRSVQTSVLQPYRPSANGMSSTDYDRVLPGGTVLPTANGSSQSTYQQAVYMRLQGQDEI